MTFFQRFIAAVSVPGMIGATALLSVSGAVTATAGNPATVVEVELTESFYRALRAEGTKTYSTDKSEEYLRQIAASSGGTPFILYDRKFVLAHPGLTADFPGRSGKAPNR